MIVKGTSIGNVTGISGEYTISAEPEQTLSFAFLGYDTKEVKVGSRTTIDVTLTEQNKQISEVVVVGYAPMRKSDFTGSIASVKSSELSVTAPTVGQSLAGKVAGVEVHQTSGAPGDGVTIRVRGVNSLSASSDPLYVIDGYPASEDVFINPNDIESIDILKDAASAAIYGSRGASGVVLITTKRGKEGEAAKVSYDFSYGIQQLDHKVDLLNAVQFRDLLIDARNNSYRLRATAAGVSWSPYDDNTVRAAKGFSLAEVGIPSMFYDFTTRTPVTPQYDTDWQDELFSNAGIMRHNVSVTGGSKAIKYMASLGYMDQDGIISPSNHNRINARLNLDAQITKRLSVSLSYSMYDAKNRVVQAEGRMINDGVIQSALMYLPNLPAYEENGDYARSAMIKMKTEWGMNFPENPLAIAHELDIQEKMSRHNLNVNMVYEFIPDLKLSARLGQQWYNYRYFYYRPMSIGRDAAVAYSDALKPYNIARTTSTYDVDRLGEFMLSYKKEFGRHHFDALAGYTLQKKTYDRLGVEATGFADDRIHEVTAHGSEATDVQLYDTRKAGWAMMSFLTRVNYAFDDRYTLTASFRADGSSRFGVDSRWGYFPSVSAGWTLSNEPFLKDALERVASIRLRASWGKSGNNDIGNYASIASISTGSYAFGNTPRLDDLRRFVRRCRARLGDHHADQHRYRPRISRRPPERDRQLLQFDLVGHPLRLSDLLDLGRHCNQDQSGDGEDPQPRFRFSGRCPRADRQGQLERQRQRLGQPQQGGEHGRSGRHHLHHGALRGFAHHQRGVSHRFVLRLQRHRYHVEGRLRQCASRPRGLSEKRQQVPRRL